MPTARILFAAAVALVVGASNAHAGVILNTLEGYDNAEWILLDYGTVVAHVFQPQQRDFYRIEELWADAKRQDIQEESFVPKAN